MKISELTEDDCIHISTKKEAKGIAELSDSNVPLMGFSTYKSETVYYPTSSTYGRVIKAKRRLRNIIPASKFLKHSISKKELQEALSKVGEELSSMNERLVKLEAKSEPKTANGIEIHFDEVTEGLPERWCIKITEENKDVLHKWRVNRLYDETFSTNAVGWYVNYLGNAWNVVKEGYTEITFETFKKYVLKEEVKEAVELEVGKWYTLREDSNVIACYRGEHRAYGLKGNGIWSNDIKMSQIDYWEPATESEIFEALKAEAEKRGFKEGVTVNFGNHTRPIKITNYEYLPDWGGTIALSTGIDIVFRGDKGWATIIPQPEAIDFSKAGQLVKHYNSDMIVLTTGKEHRGMFSGVKVYDPYNLSYVGEYSDVWEAKMWKSTTNSVTLKNE